VLTVAERQAIAAKGYRAATEAAARIRDLLAELWARRTSTGEHGAGYTVVADSDMAARIEEVLTRSKRTLKRTPGQDDEPS
jgi:hypothetical protein